MRILGICGRKESGKSLLSGVLVEKYGYVKFTFDNAIKTLICKLLNIDRSTLEILKNEPKTLDFVPNDEVCSFISEQTEIPNEIVLSFFKKYQTFTMRELLQKMGTELIRAYNKDWHVNKVKNNIINLLNENKDANIIVDDVRFPNELEMLKSFSAELFFVIRPSNFKVTNHESDVSITWDSLDIKQENIIINDCTKDALLYEWETFITTNNKNTKYNVFCTFDKVYKGNYYAFHKDFDVSLKDIFLAGYILSQKEDLTYNCLNENGIVIKTNSSFIKDVAIDVLKCDYYIDNDNYIIELYNPFIIENLKSYMSY